jgi:hypothetical protein
MMGTSFVIEAFVTVVPRGADILIDASRGRSPRHHQSDGDAHSMARFTAS